jgi:carotenoid cleavage dioxygenase-like enzyme
MMTQTVSYHQLDKDFKSINKVNIKTTYLPIIHDFSSINNKTIITDAPLLYNSENFLKKKFPVKLDKSKNTIIHILNHKNFTVESFKTNESFYLFHYADCKENDDSIEIYASLYDYLDFSELNITGKYRKIVIDKKQNSTFIQKNRELEKLDLDFPLKFDENKIVLRNLDKNIIDGFVVCEKLKIIKRIHLKERFFCGEPAIFYIEKIPYLITFAFNYNNIEENFLILINMRNYKIIEIPIREKLSIGFHSIYLNR